MKIYGDMKYRVDLLLKLGKWVEYTSLKRPIALEMATSLAEHLKRNSTGNRIVDIKTGEIVSEWLPRD